jgi:putative sigma-54 modulation protein
MKFHYFFKNTDTSEALIEFANEGLLRVCRFLLKDGKGDVYLSKSKLEWKVDVTINSAEGKFAAQAKSENVYAAMDMIFDKLERQFVKKKKRIQLHKNFEKSRQGRLELLNAELEMNFNPHGSHKKAS